MSDDFGIILKLIRKDEGILFKYFYFNLKLLTTAKYDQKNTDKQEQLFQYCTNAMLCIK